MAKETRITNIIFRINKNPKLVGVVAFCGFELRGLKIDEVRLIENRSGFHLVYPRRSSGEGSTPFVYPLSFRLRETIEKEVISTFIEHRDMDKLRLEGKIRKSTSDFIAKKHRKSQAWRTT